MDKYSLRKKIREGLPVLGTWNTLGSPLVSEVLAAAGLDFVLIDLEHGPCDLSNVHQYVSSVALHGASPIVRVPTCESWMILQALDQGAQGVMVPHVEDAETARRLVRSAKYFPEGDRGFSPFTKAGAFHSRELHVADANDTVLTAVIIESLPGLENLDQLLSVPSLDVVYFGAYDLSQALGVPGQSRHERVVTTVRGAIEKVNRSGKCAGGFVAENEKDIEWCLELGLRFITLGVDSHILYRSVASVAKWFDAKRGPRGL